MSMLIDMPAIVRHEITVPVTTGETGIVVLAGGCRRGQADQGTFCAGHRYVPSGLPGKTVPSRPSTQLLIAAARYQAGVRLRTSRVVANTAAPEDIDLHDKQLQPSRLAMVWKQAGSSSPIKHGADSGGVVHRSADPDGARGHHPVRRPARPGKSGAHQCRSVMTVKTDIRRCVSWKRIVWSATAAPTAPKETSPGGCRHRLCRRLHPARLLGPCGCCRGRTGRSGHRTRVHDTPRATAAEAKAARDVVTVFGDAARPDTLAEAAVRFLRGAVRGIHLIARYAYKTPKNSGLVRLYSASHAGKIGVQSPIEKTEVEQRGT